VKTKPEPYTNTGWAKEINHEKTGIEMAFIPAGEFMMGSPDSEKNRRQNEGPLSKVKMPKPFYMGKHEVRQSEWQKVMGNNPSFFTGSDNLPVETVRWNECQDFCRKAGDGLRLPTEAEWEYACRAGSTGAYCFGDDPGLLGDYAWYVGNSRTVHDVGEKKANAWGLHDMHGNVSEWCQTKWQASYRDYADDNQAGGDSLRVERGGGFNSSDWLVRCARRFGDRPDGLFIGVGFRVALSLP
jgi:formylglycine-generating enzyme required for sulfatase activity